MIPQRINRAVWRRGEGGLSTFAYNGRMCILGLCLFDAGIQEKWLLTLGTPYQIHQRQRLPADWLWLLNDSLGYGWMTTISPDASEIMIINDRVGDDTEREAKLIALFARNGIELTFYTP